MLSTFYGLTIAYTGLQAANTSLVVAGHNVSNINSDGYSRQQAITVAADALRTHNTSGTLGTGVIVKEVKRLRDSYYDAKYYNNQSLYGEYEAKNNYMTQTEDYMNEFILEGFTTELKNFFAAVNQLTLTPGEDAAKNQLVNNAKSMADYFNTLSVNLRNLQADANKEIRDAVEHINSLSKSIASLNKQINQIEANAGNANDLRDKRNAILDELSSIVNISTTEEDLGNGLSNFTVRINGQSLVAGYNYSTLNVEARAEARNASDASQLYDIYWSSGQPFNMYSTSLGGELRGLIDFRDGCNGEIESIAKDDTGNFILDSDGNKMMATTAVSSANTEYKGIPFYQSQLNQFAQLFSEEVNKILKSGLSSDGMYKGQSLFVTNGQTEVMTATNIGVSQELIDHPERIAIKKVFNTGEAHELIMEDLNKLQTSKAFDGGSPTYFLESIVSDLSIDANKAKSLLRNYNNLKDTIHNQRLSVMGVDTDEEAMDLMKYQQAYNLNSKMLSVMNQIYDKLINQTGL